MKVPRIVRVLTLFTVTLMLLTGGSRAEPQNDNGGGGYSFFRSLWCLVTGGPSDSTPDEEARDGGNRSPEFSFSGGDAPGGQTERADPARRTEGSASKGVTEDDSGEFYPGIDFNGKSAG